MVCSGCAQSSSDAQAVCSSSHNTRRKKSAVSIKANLHIADRGDTQDGHCVVRQPRVCRILAPNPRDSRRRASNGLGESQGLSQQLHATATTGSFIDLFPLHISPNRQPFTLVTLRQSTLRLVRLHSRLIQSCLAVSDTCASPANHNPAIDS